MIFLSYFYRFHSFSIFVFCYTFLHCFGDFQLKIVGRKFEYFELILFLCKKDGQHIFFNKLYLSWYFTNILRNSVTFFWGSRVLQLYNYLETQNASSFAKIKLLSFNRDIWKLIFSVYALIAYNLSIIQSGQLLEFWK